MNKTEWLLKTLIDELDSTSRNTLAYRKTMHVYYLLSLILTAAITVVVGISAIPHGKEIALVLAAITSIFTGIQSTERFYDRIHNWSTFDFELTNIKQRLEFYVAGKSINSIPDDNDFIKELNDEYLVSKKKFNNKWTSHFTKKSD